MTLRYPGLAGEVSVRGVDGGLAGGDFPGGVGGESGCGEGVLGGRARGRPFVGPPLASGASHPHLPYPFPSSAVAGGGASRPRSPN